MKMMKNTTAAICLLLFGLSVPAFAEEADVNQPGFDVARSDSEVSDEQVSDEQVSDEQVSDEQVSDEQVSDEQVSDEQVSDEQVSDEQVSDEQVSDEQVSDEQVSDEQVSATAPSSTQQARAALQQNEDDITSEKNLEEVFEAAEKNYSMLGGGDVSMAYSFGYSYYRNTSYDISVEGSTITRFRVENIAAHSFSNSLSLSYGFRPNISLGMGFPVLVKLDTEADDEAIALGDVSFSMRWQPVPATNGGLNTTLFGSIKTATGDSPYEGVEAKPSTGSGFYSMSGGASVSKIADPVVLFGSLSYGHNFDLSGINQWRSGDILLAVSPGDSVSFSFGMAYQLSYDVSLSASYQQSYSFQSVFTFQNSGAHLSGDSTSSVIGTSLGLRVSPERILNMSFGFGLTEDSPDVTMGVSLPIDLSGLKGGF